MDSGIIKMLACAALLSACGTGNRQQKETEEKNLNIAREVYEQFNRHNWEKMAALYKDASEFKDPSLGPGIVKQTREQTTAKYKRLQEISADIHDDIVQVYPSGDKHVIVEFVSSGTAPNGAKWSLPLCTIFTFENGQIVKDFTYYDMD